MSSNGKQLHISGLWRIRRKRGLERKQVAWMLGHQSPDPIARYERGERRPSLDTAIKLAVLYDCPIEEIFGEKYDVLRSELSSRTLKVPRTMFSTTHSSNLMGKINRCSYERLFEESALNDVGKTAIRDHVTNLAKHLARL